MLDGYWPYVIVVMGAVAVVLFLLYVTRLGKKSKEKEATVASPMMVEEKSGFIAELSVTIQDAKEARSELKSLDLERGILSDALRRLYEAHAEGEITEEEREKLAKRYKSRMKKVKKTISRRESVVALHELESMRGDLLKLFSTRFDEINSKIGDIRSKIEVKAKTETPVVSPVSTPASTTKEKRREIAGPRQRPPKKTDADKRIEEIKAEVEKVLERLGQIEVEA